MPKTKKPRPLSCERLYADLIITILALSVMSSGVRSAPRMSTRPCDPSDCRNQTSVPDAVCTNEEGWNLQGSDWGCCGNYEGCCTYASFICYLHDAMCRCCDIGHKLCGPECKPEPYCENAHAQHDVSYETVSDNQHLPRTTNDNSVLNMTENVTREIPSDSLRDEETISVRNVKYSKFSESSSTSAGYQDIHVTNGIPYPESTRDDPDEGSGDTEEKIAL